MSHDAGLDQVLSQLPPKTRREFLKQVAALGLSATAAQALLIRNPRVVTAAPSPGRGGTVRVTGHHEISSLSPDDSGPLVHFVVVTNIHNALLEVNENYVLERVLAEHHEAAKDGMSYTFRLRRGVKFHDGREFTAEDVKYTYEWYLNPASNAINAADFAGVDRILTPDKYTVVVRMKEPNSAFLRRGARAFIVPAHYHSRVGEKTYKTAAMGTGPFRLKEWRPAEYTLLEAFDQHFRGRPRLDFFREDIVPEGSVRAIALRTGTSQGNVWPLLAEDNIRFAQDRNFKVLRTISNAVNHFPINTDLPFFADKRVRQAVMHAVDRQRLIDDVFKGTAVLAHTNLSPGLSQWQNTGVKKYDYSPQKAKALLAEAGWRPGRDGILVKDGRRFSFTCNVITGDRARRPEAEVAQQDLAAVGIEMKIVERPVATILNQLPKGEMDASLFNWTYGGAWGEPDAGSTLKSGQLRNFSRYKSARMDELLGQGVREVDPAKRK
ncbi:MAG: ABC transporter substrate-binding protein, partial [Armatimonadetes bacterium]|nr:ABC transporter substrate-binding protein [Armatimonadota bacterium]